MFIIYSEGNLVLEYSDKYDEDFLELLEETEWGSEDTLYTMHNLKEEFDKFNEAYYVRLVKDSKLAGVCVFNRKYVKLKEAAEVFYISVLSVRNNEKGKGYGTLMLEKASEYFLRRNNKAFLYAYVEKENERSVKAFVKSGYQNLGGFKVSVFSRLSPKSSRFVRKLAINEESLISSGLKEFYKEYLLEDLEQSLNTETYYVFEEGGEILVGVQVKKFVWTLSKLPGIGGSLVLKVLPYTPVLNRLINPKHYAFLKIGNIYMKDNCEDRLRKLLEHILYESKLHMAMFYSDMESPLFKKSSNLINSGILSKTVDTRADIMVKYSGFSKEEIEVFRDRPIHISMMDSI